MEGGPEGRVAGCLLEVRRRGDGPQLASSQVWIKE